MVIQSDKFTLRPLRIEDAERMAVFCNNKKIWLNMRNRFAHPYTLENANIFIEDCLNRDPLNVLAIEVHGECSGTIGIFPGEDVYIKNGELGYCLAEEHWGKGVITEAVKLFMDLYITKQFNLARIYATVFGWNPASMRVLEKCGFEREGIGKNGIYKDGKFTDEHRFAKMVQ